MASVYSPDLTAIYYTANLLPERFWWHTQYQLYLCLREQHIPVVLVSQKPYGMEDEGYHEFEVKNIVVALPRSQASIYRQVLIGAKEATSKYVACIEDDVLYSPEHFKFRPKDGHWGYNMNAWSIFTWGEPMFTYKPPGGRRNLNGLICERELLIKHLEERFKLWPGEVDINIFGEPGKYDNQLGTTPYPSQDFYCNPPNIVFSHQANLQFEGLGTRKALGQVRATEIPYWGKASDIASLYS